MMHQLQQAMSKYEEKKIEKNIKYVVLLLGSLIELNKELMPPHI